MMPAMSPLNNYAINNDLCDDDSPTNFDTIREAPLSQKNQSSSRRVTIIDTLEDFEVEDEDRLSDCN